MARTKTEIKENITTSFMANEAIQAVYGFGTGASFDDTFSKTSLENLFFGVIAYAIFIHEHVFEKHQQEINQALATQKRGTLSWYHTMSLRFQYGFELMTDSDTYDNTGVSDEVIQESKIIKYAAVNESQTDSRVIIKIAGETANTLKPITPEEQTSFEAYINEIKFAGVKTTVINYLPDRLYLTMTIIRDPLVINSQGVSILEGSRPVELAVWDYLRNLPFNGEFVLAHLVDRLQQVQGVRIPHIVEAQSSWIDPAIGDYGTPISIHIRTIPTSGYFTIVDFENIEYVV